MSSNKKETWLEALASGKYGGLWRFLSRDIWLIEVGDLSRFRRTLTRLSRVMLLAGRGFYRDSCFQQAAVLTYIAIFSMVPFLAVTFSIAKGFGADQRLRNDVVIPFLDATFGSNGEQAHVDAPEEAGAPLASGKDSEALSEPSSEPLTTDAAPGVPGVSAEDVAAASALDPTAEVLDPSVALATGELGGASEEEAGAVVRSAIDKVFDFVDRTDVSTLGVFGGFFLLYSIIKMLGAIERALNEIWGIRRARTLVRKVSDYVTIAAVSPILLVTGAGLSAFLREQGADSPALLKLVPVLVVSAAMIFLLVTIPNTRIRLASAIFGGIIAAFLWQGIQLLHVEGQLGLARFNKLYSGFAAFPMFLLWIYFSWVALLAGAELAFAHQNERVYTSIAQTGEVDQAYREALAPRLAGRIAAAFLRGERAPTGPELANDLCVAMRVLSVVLEDLVAYGLLARSSDGEEDGYLPARDVDTITIAELLRALRHDGVENAPPVRNRLDERVDRLLAALEDERDKSLHNFTLRELARVLEDRGESQATRDEPGPAAREVRPEAH